MKKNFPNIELLQPLHTNSKSFYNKAFTYETKTNIYLISYETCVAVYNKRTKKVINTWGGYSATTSKHIREFLLQLDCQAYSKKEWMEIYKKGFKMASHAKMTLEDMAQCRAIARKQIITYY